MKISDKIVTKIASLTGGIDNPVTQLNLQGP